MAVIHTLELTELQRLVASHSSSKAQGKRKVTAEDETVATPLKKSKLAAAQPVSTVRPLPFFVYERYSDSRMRHRRPPDLVQEDLFIHNHYSHGPSRHDRHRR